MCRYFSGPVQDRTGVYRYFSGPVQDGACVAFEEMCDDEVGSAHGWDGFLKKEVSWSIQFLLVTPLDTNNVEHMHAYL